jgi:hypothetical protein
MPEFFYVPLDYSDAQYYVPEEEKIIYSTCCQFKRLQGASFSVVGQIVNNALKYKTHLLITNKGFVFGQKDSEYTYIPWCTEDMSPFVYKDTIMFGNYAELKVIQDPAYETKEQFKQRMKLFHIIVIPLKLDYTKEFLQSPEGLTLDRRAIKSIEGNMKTMQNYLNKALANKEKEV